MSFDPVTYALAQKYTEDTVVGLGAVKGANCLVSEIEELDKENVITFKWIGNDGTEQTSEMRVQNGLSIVDVKIDADNKLTCTLSDGSIIESGSVNVTTDAESIPYTNEDDAEVVNVKTALDKLFEEGGGILETEFKPNVQQGSIKPVYPAGTPLEEIIRDAFTDKVPPTVSITINPAKTVYDEVTESISSLTVTATVGKKTNNIAKVEFFVNNVLANSATNVANGGTFPYVRNTAITDDTTIKVVVTDTEGLTATATKVITFIGNSYYGLVDANTGEPTEAIIKTLTKNLKTTKKLVYEGITTDWAKICYAYPSELGKLTSIMDKVNNFNYTSSFQMVTKAVDGIEYYVYTLIDPTGADNVTLTFE